MGNIIRECQIKTTVTKPVMPVRMTAVKTVSAVEGMKKLEHSALMLEVGKGAGTMETIWSVLKI